MDPDSAVTVLVWRRKPGGDELLEVVDGKSWRLPRLPEIGLRCSRIDGPIGALAEAPPGFEPERMHRWVPIRDRADVARAFAKSGASAIVWRRGVGGVEVLLLHRAVKGPDDEGDWAWCPPGGALKPGETHLECAERELLEETGLDLPLVRLHGVANGFAAHVAEHTGAEEVVLSSEHDRFEWVSIADACVRCSPAVVVSTLRAAERHIGERP